MQDMLEATLKGKSANKRDTQAVIKKCEESGEVKDKKRTGRPRNVFFLKVSSLLVILSEMMGS